ncbi:hypothetical protein LQQ63_26395 (plasmid) [Escherichia coli]|nr:hypothetical protein LQQ63_26395 [Escherichia coli]
MMTEGKGVKADILHYQDPGYQEMAPYASKTDHLHTTRLLKTAGNR